MTEEIENEESIETPSDSGADSSDSGIQTEAESPGALEDLTRERDELKDLLLRKQAEFDNYRKRTARERSEFVQYASAEVMRELLGVLDSFELALKQSADSEGAGDHRGFELIYKQLVDSLARAGLEAIVAEGQPFDPNLHEAVSTQAAPEGVDAGTVLTQLRRGYQLNGKLLRPAMVVVADAAAGEAEN